MSQEIFEIVRGMDLNCVESQLALQCAPLLAGVKLSNLLIIPVELLPQIQALLINSHLSCELLLSQNGKVTLLLFRRDALDVYLSDEKVQQFLKQAGYQNTELSGMLPLFRMRYLEYMSGRGTFPHEMGCLLGYPLEDVIGFIEHGGKNFLYAGYWKVYADADAKIRLFQEYESAREWMIRELSRGRSIQELLQRTVLKNERNPLKTRSIGN